MTVAGSAAYPSAIDHSIAWVRTPGDVAALVRALDGAASVSMDTESDNFFHYFDKVCLLQMGLPDGRVWLVDPLAVRDLAELGPLMASPALEKVFHCADNDLVLLKRDFGWSFAGLFDTGLAARIAGRSSLGLDTLLEKEFGIHHSKKYQRTDWSRRPLEPGQEAYAAEDVRHLFRLRDLFRAELKAIGRESWALEEFDALTQIPAAPAKEASDVLKARGIGLMPARDLAVLRELFAIRDVWARKADRPLFKVVSDETLFAIAAGRPRDKQALSRMKGMPRFLLERRCGELLDAVKRGEAVADADLPRRPERVKVRPPRGTPQRIARLKAWREKASARVKLDPGVLLPQRLIDALAAAPPTDLAGLESFPGLRLWRVREFGPELLEALRS